MPVLIDYNQLFIANIFQQMQSTADGEVELDMDLTRHMVLSSLLWSRRKFFKNYGQLIICVDSRHTWRHELFPQYKIRRKLRKKNDKVDWDKIYELMNQMKSELDDTFPYKVVEVPKAEADDVIACLCFYFSKQGASERCLIVSSDKDFKQLQALGNVDQFAPVAKEFIKCENPDAFKKELIIRGDSDDDVPNIFSPIKTFITEGIKSKPILQKKLEVWLGQEPDQFCRAYASSDEEYKICFRRYKQNKKLVDLWEIPSVIHKAVINKYTSPLKGSYDNLYNYFGQHGLSSLFEALGDF